MDGLEEGGSGLPTPVRIEILSYFLETTPRDLFGRVEFYLNREPMNEESRPDAVTYFIAYDKVERLFRGLIVMGEAHGIQGFSENYVRTIATTNYTFREPARAGITSLHHELRAGNPTWTFSILSNTAMSVGHLINPNRVTLPLAMRCDTRYDRRLTTYEEAQEYAPQADDMIRTLDLLRELPEVPSEEGFLEGFLKSLEKSFAEAAKAPLTPGDVDTHPVSSPSVPRDIQVRNQEQVEDARFTNRACNVVGVGALLALVLIIAQLGSAAYHFLWRDEPSL
jgi:hypothetical protein